MADLGEMTIVNLPDIMGVNDYETGELSNEYMGAALIDPEDVIKLMEPTGYYIAGTISFYTGPAVPREGQIWPRGNITNDK